MTKAYNKVKAVDYANLEVAKRETLMILGHPGSGKSTLINMLIGKSAITEGDGKLNGFSVKTE